MTKRKWTVLRIFKTVWMLGGLVFILWLFYNYQSHEVDGSCLSDDASVSVETTRDFFVFSPRKKTDTILIFFPGAMVETKAYIPLCRAIAKNGYKVYLMDMPWRLASRGYNKPKELNLLSDTTKTYLLAGHSQGGKMAAQFVYENPGMIDKLVLIATTHPRDISLADSQAPILKIYGSRDGVADEQSILKNKGKLPLSAKFVRIEGANHAQFGYYGSQLGDNHAGISREDQHRQTLGHILHFLRHTNR